MPERQVLLIEVASGMADEFGRIVTDADAIEDSGVGCGNFSAITGPSIACASTIRPLCVPEMPRMGRDPCLATASVAAGGTLGSLIPRSVPFIICGILTETSISWLFLAGVSPGLLMPACLVAVIAGRTAREPAPAPGGGGVAGRERTRAAPGARPAPLLFALIAGGVRGGASTATEAAAIGLGGASAIGVLPRRPTVRGLWKGPRATWCRPPPSS